MTNRMLIIVVVVMIFLAATSFQAGRLAMGKQIEQGLDEQPQPAKKTESLISERYEMVGKDGTIAFEEGNPLRTFDVYIVKDKQTGGEYVFFCAKKYPDQAAIGVIPVLPKAEYEASKEKGE